MAAAVNRVTLLGVVSAEIDEHVTPSGQTVCSFVVSTTEQWQGKDGQGGGQRVEQHRVVAWAEMAKVCKDSVRKDHLVLVDGKVMTRNWDDKDGTKHYVTEIIAQQLIPLGKPTSPTIPGMNRIFVVGNLGKDPELKSLPSGQEVCEFSVATTDPVSKNGGTPHTEWHRVVVWGRSAKNCKDYLAKGRPVHIEGRLQSKTSTDRDGRQRTFTDLVAQQVQFLGNRGQNEGQQMPRDDDYPSAPVALRPTAVAPQRGRQVDDSDIPF